MLNATRLPHSQPHPLKTLVGVIGIMFGLLFLLQNSNALGLAFDLTNPLYLKIFAVYAIIAGALLVINFQRHGVIRY